MGLSSGGVEFTSIERWYVATHCRSVLSISNIYSNLYDDIQQAIDDEDRVFALSEVQWFHVSCIFQIQAAIKLSCGTDLLYDVCVSAPITNLK